jgi:hypothetical protein
LHQLALFHLIEQLDLSVRFWHAMTMAADCEDFPVGPEDQARSDRLWDLVRMAGYKLCVEADAWRRLHAELHIDPEASLAKECTCRRTLIPAGACSVRTKPNMPTNSTIANSPRSWRRSTLSNAGFTQPSRRTAWAEAVLAECMSLLAYVHRRSHGAAAFAAE